MYLFDTDALTNVLKPKPAPALLDRLKILPRHDQFTTTITVGEIVYGAWRSRTPDIYLERLDQILLPRVTILPFGRDAAYHYGALRAQLEREGTPVAHPDLQIAAIAITHGLILITGNLRHFDRIPGLAVENWLQESTI